MSDSITNIIWKHKKLDDNERRNFITLVLEVEHSHTIFRIIKSSNITMLLWVLYVLSFVISIIYFNPNSLSGNKQWINLLIFFAGVICLQVVFVATHIKAHALFLEYKNHVPGNQRCTKFPVYYYAFYHHHHYKNDNWAPFLSYYDQDPYWASLITESNTLVSDSAIKQGDNPNRGSFVADSTIKQGGNPHRGSFVAESNTLVSHSAIKQGGNPHRGSFVAESETSVSDSTIKQGGNGMRNIIASHWYSYTLFAFPLKILMVLIYAYVCPTTIYYFLGYEIGVLLLPIAHAWQHIDKQKFNPVIRCIFTILEKLHIVANGAEHHKHHNHNGPTVYQDFSSSGIYMKKIDEWINKKWDNAFYKAVRIKKPPYDIISPFIECIIICAFVIVPFSFTLLN